MLNLASIISLCDIIHHNTHLLLLEISSIYLPIVSYIAYSCQITAYICSITAFYLQSESVKCALLLVRTELNNDD